MMNKYSIARLPRIEFGSGKRFLLPELIARFGRRCLLVTGSASFQLSDRWNEFTESVSRHSISLNHVKILNEPSPGLIDDIVAKYAGCEIDVVVAIGGGSAMDAGKAIAGLLRIQDSVMDYLEGVGPEKQYLGPTVPFIAVPTTAGTGSEATKNAVLSIQGESGFKKSFRDEKLVAEYAVVDPDLLMTCPPHVIAANGMDALTQLIESFVSVKSNPFTDALALDGLRAVRDGLLPLYSGQGDLMQARENMSHGALISGITLAQVGLGSVHGLASPLGAFFPIPHGVVCGTLVAEATRTNINAMLARDADNLALGKYKRIAEILCHQHFPSNEEAWDSLLRLLTSWIEKMDLSRLSGFGVSTADIDRIVTHSRGSSMQTNPIKLTDPEIASIVAKRI